MAAGVGIALLTGTVTPAIGLPFEFQSGAQPQPEARRHVARPARGKAVAARRDKEKAKPDGSAELLAKAKDPFNIIISTNRQQLTIYSGEKPIVHSRVSTGTPGHPTPHGIFSVIQKDRWHHSNLYGDAPMYFMQRITWSGVAMHQGVVPNHPASHGCIRLPPAFAKQLWGMTKLGVRVIVARTDLAPVAIAHPSLFKFVPKREPEAPDQVEMVRSGGSSTDGVKAAYNQASNVPPGDTNSNAGPTATDVPKPADPALDAVAKVKPLKPGPISVFISRKERKLYVRKGFQPLFETPVTIDRPDEALGTHVFTAMEFKDDGVTMRWTAISMLAEPAKAPKAS